MNDPFDVDPLRRGLLLSGVGLAGAALGAPALAGQQQGGPPNSTPVPPVPTRPSARPMPKLEQPLPEPAGGRVGWAVVGLGKFALGEIMPAFGDCRLSKPVALVSGSPGKARDVGGRYGVTRFYDYRNFDAIRDDPAIDVVYVILPNSMHEEYTIRALKAGKHVFCEKPMATSPAACERMIRAARDAGKQLGVAYRAHWEPHNVKALELIRAGRIGTLRHFQSLHGRPLKPDDPADQWRAKKALSGGGSLPDIGIYALNAARMFAGEEPVEVAATIHNPPGDPRFAEIEDLVSFRLRFPGGMIADCASSYSVQEQKNYQLYGTTGSIRLDPATDYLRNTLMLKNEEGESEIEAESASLQFPREIDGFSQAVGANRPFRTPGEEGLRDERLIQAIYKAARDGGSVRV
jgi:glucose-fructose oxidoreductase